MSFSFSIPSKTQSNRPKNLSSTDDRPPATFSSAASSTRKYVNEFNPAEAPPPADSIVTPIPPIPDNWKPIKKLKNLPNLPSISQSNGTDSTLQFELDPGFNREASDTSMSYGLNLRQVTENDGKLEPSGRESISDLELRRLKEDLEKLQEDTGMDEYEDVPVEGFGAALLSGYGWKEGMGIGRNVKEDVKVFEIKKKSGRGGLGFIGELPEKPIKRNSEAVDNGRNGNARRDKRGDEKEKQSFGIGKEVRIVSGEEIGKKGQIIEVKRGGDILVLKLSGSGENVKVQVKDVAELGSAKEDVKVTKKFGKGGLGFSGELTENQTEISAKAFDNGRNGNVRQNKIGDEKEQEAFDIGKEVRIVSGKDIGMKGRITELGRGKDMLVLRLSKTGEKVKARVADVAEFGSAEEVKCLRRLKESKSKEEKIDSGKGDRNPSRKTSREEATTVTERVNWLRNHIRVRIISKELNGGRLFLKKGVVMDVVRPGMCDISMDDSRELIQGVGQDCLETALPKSGGPVLVLSGRYKGAYGCLLERDSEKETGTVQDSDTHEILNVNLEQIAEYTGDPSGVGY